MSDEGQADKPQGYFDQNMDAPELCRLAIGSCAVFSRRCPDKVPNEDAAILIPAGNNAAVLAVADGCGGMPGGEQAARLAVEALQEPVSRASDDSLRAAILDGIEQANQAVLSLGTGAATTISIVEVNGQTIRPMASPNPSVQNTATKVQTAWLSSTARAGCDPKSSSTAKIFICSPDGTWTALESPGYRGTTPVCPGIASSVTLS